MVDLSADFRLDQAAYEHWYQPHEAPELLDEAVYGCPRSTAPRSRRGSGRRPGCNSTAALLALLPLRGASRRRRRHQGRRVRRRARGTDETHFVSVVDNVNAYKVEGTATRPSSSRSCRAHFSFVAHLMPIDQDPGELLRAAVEPITQARRTSPRGGLRHEPFVDVLDYPPRTRDVRDTNRAAARSRW